MTGVEILATQEVATAFTFNLVDFCIVIAIFLFGGFLLGVLISVAESDWRYMWTIFVGVFVGLIAGALVGNTNHVPSEYET